MVRGLEGITTWDLVAMMIGLWLGEERQGGMYAQGKEGIKVGSSCWLAIRGQKAERERMSGPNSDDGAGYICSRRKRKYGSEDYRWVREECSLLGWGRKRQSTRRYKQSKNLSAILGRRPAAAN